MASRFNGRCELWTTIAKGSCNCLSASGRRGISGVRFRKDHTTHDLCRQSLSLVWTFCLSRNCGCGRRWTRFRPDFVLYGGTGLALQIGHRFSEDFDFFSSSGFDPARLQSRLPFFRDLDGADADAWVRYKADNLEGFVDRGDPVKVAFFGGLNTLQRVQDPLRAAGSRVRVASLVDLAGMKMRVIQVRGSWKDYIDIPLSRLAESISANRVGCGNGN